MEEWKDIKGYEGLYLISSYGRCKTTNFKPGYGRIPESSECILKIENPDYHQGYALVSLSKNGKKKKFRIHRLVAEAFIPNPNNYPCVNHIDGNKLNNNVNNLEWCTEKQNMEHAAKFNLVNRGRQQYVKQLTLDGQVIKIYKSIREASRETNICRDSITKCLKGKQKQCGNFKWEYVENK